MPSHESPASQDIHVVRVHRVGPTPQIPPVAAATAWLVCGHPRTQGPPGQAYLLGSQGPTPQFVLLMSGSLVMVRLGASWMRRASARPREGLLQHGERVVGVHEDWL